MKFIDFSYQNPAQNVAADEALLDHCESNQEVEVLRFWESPKACVVLGYSNHASKEAHVKECERASIAVLRRPSGGGTVLQGPGCLNYALVLKIDNSPEYQSITKANCEIMKRQQKALQRLTDAKVEVQGFTDLTINHLKFSGNAQRRKKDYLLFHGTILYHFDLKKISQYLPLPSKQPDYRNKRSHDDFLTNFEATDEEIKRVLRDEWQAMESLDLPQIQRSVDQLVDEKYGRREWNFKY